MALNPATAKLHIEGKQLRYKDTGINGVVKVFRSKIRKANYSGSDIIVELETGEIRKLKSPLYNMDELVKQAPRQTNKTREKKTSKSNGSFLNSNTASVIGGFVAGRTSKKSKPKTKSNDEEEEIINSFANELTHFHNISFTNNVEDLTNKLDEIYYGMKSYKWKFASDGINKLTITENNRSLTKCLNKFEHGLKLLYNTTEDEELKKEYNKKYKKLNRKKIFNKFGLVICLVLLFFIIILALWIME